MSHLTVPELKSYLEANHLSQDGKKPELVKRYQRYVSLLKMSLNELKTECEDNHVSRTGTKTEIIVRLMGDDAIPITRHSERPASPRVVPRIEQIYAEEAQKERSRSPARRSRSRSPAPRARSRSKSPATRARSRSKSPARARDRSKSPAPRSPKLKTKTRNERKDKPTPVTSSVEKAVELGPLIVSPFVNIASATDGQPCISVFDPIIRTRVTKDGDYTSYDQNADSGEGRVVIDCGLTKLVHSWDDAGTARYVVNATCWLYAMERLRAAEAPERVAEAKAAEAKAEYKAPATATATATESKAPEAKMDTSEEAPAILRRTPSNTQELSWDEQERLFALKYYNPAFGLPLPPPVTTPASSADADAAPTPVVADVPRDRHFNPAGTKYDLARDDAFVGFTVIIANFCTVNVPNDKMESGPIKALRGKGFTVDHIDAHNNMQQCIEKIQTSDTTKTCVWVISTAQKEVPTHYLRDFIPVLDTHHEKGGGILAFGDNDPYNVIVNEWLNRFGVYITGDYYGMKEMTFDIDFNDDWRVRGGDINKPTLSKHGAFGSHLIFTGISRLYEGATISHPAGLLSTKRIPASIATKEV